MRLFVAVWLPDEGVELLCRLPRPAIDGVRWTPAEQWHVTLRFLGRVDDDGVEAALGALASVSVSVGMGPAALAPAAVMGPVSELLSPRVLCVPVAGLDGVAAAVAKAFESVGEPAEDRRFRGHVTLARMKGLGRREARELAGEPIALEWPVREIALVRSHLGGGPAGTPARYEVVASRPLGPRPA